MKRIGVGHVARIPFHIAREEVYVFSTSAGRKGPRPTLLERNNVIITAKSLEQPRSVLLTLLLSFGPTLLLQQLGVLPLSRQVGA